MSFSICLDCGANVDLHDTFRDACPECGGTTGWNDNPADLERRVAAIRSNASEEDEVQS